jgi:hypothetical protein
MSTDVIESGNFTNTTQAATPLTVSGARKLIGVLCNSTSSGTFAITDSDGNVVTGVITPDAGDFVRVPAHLASDAVITMTNTINITLFWGN